MAKQQHTAREAVRAIAQVERMIEAGHGMTYVSATLGVPELTLRRWWMKYGDSTPSVAARLAELEAENAPP